MYVPTPPRYVHNAANMSWCVFVASQRKREKRKRGNKGLTHKARSERGIAGKNYDNSNLSTRKQHVKSARVSVQELNAMSLGRDTHTHAESPDPLCAYMEFKKKGIHR